MRLATSIFTQAVALQMGQFLFPRRLQKRHANDTGTDEHSQRLIESRLRPQPVEVRLSVLVPKFRNVQNGGYRLAGRKSPILHEPLQGSIQDNVLRSWDGIRQNCKVEIDDRLAIDMSESHRRIEIGEPGIERHEEGGFLGGKLPSCAYFSTLPCMTMIVCCINAQSDSLPSLTANTSALVMISVRPGRTT